MSGERFVRLACELAGRPYRLQVAPSWMLRLMGLFMPVLRENQEMMYQFEHDYRFDSSKFGLIQSVENIPVESGQLQFEWQHLQDKLARRNPDWRARLGTVGIPACHPLFVRRSGPIASWERHR